MERDSAGSRPTPVERKRFRPLEWTERGWKQERRGREEKRRGSQGCGTYQQGRPMAAGNESQEKGEDRAGLGNAPKGSINQGKKKEGRG